MSASRFWKLSKKNETPGNDGLTMEFSFEFWSVLAKPLVNCLNFAHYYEELFNSQKQAFTTLLKNDKDRRFIFDTVRTIDVVLEYVKITKKSGILVTIDFEKAFGTFNHTYLLKVLQEYDFGPYVIQWIQTFYTNISSCVLNNGFTTDLFQISRVVR